MRVYAYRNLNKDCYSYKEKKSGKVAGYSEELVIKDASFVVSEAQRQWVLKHKQRQVHAWVCGELVGKAPAGEWRLVRYNPYVKDSFFDAETGAPIASARYVHLRTDGKAYVII
jgi:hypothetical protein